MKGGARVRDLPKDPAHGVCLLCTRCHDTFSACRGDYWTMRPHERMRCRCQQPLVLVRRVVRFVPYRAA